jgi:hypothetical protein
MPRVETGQTILLEAFAPARDGWPGSTQLGFDLGVALACGESQNQARTEDVTGW